ncbi:MAG: hypothetical protein RR585_05070, partial [Coprobacillus sp.]
RQLGKWVIEGEKKLKYEEGLQQGIEKGIEKGKENERKVILNLLLKEKYSNESLLWLDECSNDQLQDVFKYVYTNISMNDLKSTIFSR